MGGDVGQGETERANGMSGVGGPNGPNGPTGTTGRSGSTSKQPRVSQSKSDMEIEKKALKSAIANVDVQVLHCV